jgi:hypothetical protein|tara:strand:- start:274 stop:585 length:312 start_codon:yes stop_codon:yes gene_type:complete
MAGINRVAKLKQNTKNFSVLINQDDYDTLYAMGQETGHSIGHMIRESATARSRGETYEKGIKKVLDLVSSSSLIKGDDLPDGQKYSEYVADRIAKLVKVKSSI